MKISVTRALAEVKLIGQKIDKKIRQGNFLAIVKGQEAPKGAKSLDEFETKSRANFQAIEDLFDRRNAIKHAIILSNAKTEVQIGEKTMTVAEAIELKSSIIYKKSLLSYLKDEFSYKTSDLEGKNQRVQQRCDQLVEANLGKNVKAKTDEYEAIVGPFMARNEFKLIDPINITEKIESLQKEIDDFLLNVDFSLSESNARTEIELPD